MTPAAPLIAEDLLLLLTDDRTGKLAVASNGVDIALGGAMLIDLAMSHRVEVAGAADTVRTGRLVVRDASSTSDSLLDAALAELADEEGKKPRDVVTSLGKGLRPRLYGRLAERGLLHEDTGRILGLVPTHRWPADDPAHENAVRTALVHALRVGAADDLHVGALISLLHALHAVDRVVDPAMVDVTKQQLKANAKHIAEGDWASEAVRAAIDALTAGIVAATSSTAVAAGSP